MTNNADYQYLALAKQIIETGAKKEDRTGTGTLSIFGAQMRFDLNEGFPILTTKKVHFPSVVKELLWFISGDTNNKTLQDQGVRIWNEWATKEQCAKFGRSENDLGPIYGQQYRNFGASRELVFNPETDKVMWKYNKDGFDQFKCVIEDIRNNPNSRRLIISAWDPKTMQDAALPCCHNYIQFGVTNGRLNCYYSMRSNDWFLGQPFNTASYALLTHLVARECGLEVGELVYSGVDVHVYLNHVEALQEQMTREPYPLPKLVFSKNAPLSIFNIKHEDISLEGYQHHPPIKAPVAV